MLIDKINFLLLESSSLVNKKAANAMIQNPEVNTANSLL